MSASARLAPPRPRAMGRFNVRGLWTLYLRGAKRFFKLWIQSLGAPIVSSLLFLAVFTFALSERVAPPAHGVEPAAFIAPGIVVFAMMHAAFEAAASPILYDKLEGMIQDITAAPLSALELLIGYAGAAATGGVAVALVTALAMSQVVEWSVPDPARALLFVALGALVFSLVGTLVGLWADRWEHYSAAEIFAVVPLGLLSGTFYSIERLPETAQTVIAFNPVFYMIDGARGGIVPVSESDPRLGAAVLIALILALGALLWRLFAVGYKIRQ